MKLPGIPNILRGDNHISCPTRSDAELSIENRQRRTKIRLLLLYGINLEHFRPLPPYLDMHDKQNVSVLLGELTLPHPDYSTTKTMHAKRLF